MPFSVLVKAHTHAILCLGKGTHMPFSVLVKAHTHDILWLDKDIVLLASAAFAAVVEQSLLSRD